MARVLPVLPEQMRALDARAQTEFCLPDEILMEHAGTEIAKFIFKQLRDQSSVLILCGPGANGGDGFVVARHLHNWGVAVDVLVLAAQRRIRAAAGKNLRRLKPLGIPVTFASTARQWTKFEAAWLQKPTLCVDALLGTGFSGRMRSPLAEAVAWLNHLPGKILSVDIPSGLSGVTGKCEDVAVKADWTLACGRPQKGLLSKAALDYVGQLQVADIGLPKVLRECTQF